MSTNNATGRPVSGIYRVRREGKGGALTVPRAIYEQIPEGTMFKLTVTDQGLLYEITEEVNAFVQAPNVNWLNKEAS